MANIFSRIFGRVRNFLGRFTSNVGKKAGKLYGAFDEGSTEFYKAYEQYKKITTQKARVVYAESSGQAYGLDEPIFAHVNKELKMAKIPGVNRLFFIKKDYRTEGGTPLIFLAEGNHETLDLDEFRSYLALVDKKRAGVEDLADVMTGRLKKEQDKLDALGKLSFNDFDMAVDLNLKDSREALDFTEMADKVMTSNLFKLLEDLPNRTVILLIIAGFLAGSTVTLSLFIMSIVSIITLKGLF